MKTVLTIAGSDSSGGAGIQADLKTFIANGTYGMSAITALTAQNTTGVSDIMNVSPAFLGEQIDAICQDIFPDAVKIGMISNPELVKVIAQKIKEYELKHIILDPVMVSTNGSTLMDEQAIVTLKSDLFPLADIITPNLYEAEILADIKIESKSDMEKAAQIIEAKLGTSVLVKGGHSKTKAQDVLYFNDQLEWFEGKVIQNDNTHGTGCTLSSAIAANLAKGMKLTDAVARAKSYLTGALAADLNLGKGSGPLNHHYDLSSAFIS